MSSYDYVLVGGGLQSGLIALAVRASQPDATIALVERDSRLGGNHTWCFHHHDVPEESRVWLDRLVSWRWDGYTVYFPGEQHDLDEPYAGVSSERLHDTVSSSISEHSTSDLFLEKAAVSVEWDRVVLDDGTVLHGQAVIDARGAPRDPDGPSRGAAMRAGYQKFVGLEVELREAHGLERPVLMDARVDQSEGFRFFYLLPFTERTLLIEDTRFHDSPTLEVEKLKDEIESYAASRGWVIEAVLREERGVLPMPWEHEIRTASSAPLVAGYRGGWFHPGTGYSFPIALRLAQFIASRPAASLFGPELRRFAREHREQARFPRFLNRLLFRWYPPSGRYPIFARVYRLPRSVLRNFYALKLTQWDRVRLLVGRPPKGFSPLHRMRGASRS